MILEVKGLSGGYPGREVFSGISLTLKAGQALCLLGPNGSGKTTLLKTLLGFLPAFGGEILLEGQPLGSLPPRGLAQCMAYIPQSHNPTFAYTVREMVLMGRTPHIAPFSTPGKEDICQAELALERLGLTSLQDTPYTCLSGGERRLVLIARALCQQAGLLVMDEPTSDLDYANQLRVGQIIRQLRGEGLGILFTTHAPESPFSLADQVLLLQEGSVCAQGSPFDALTDQALSAAYGLPMQHVQLTDATGQTRHLILPLEQA